MDQEQKKLLFKIAELMVEEFTLQMKDGWTHTDFVESGMLNRQIREFSKLYKETYGELPEWKFIDDVCATLKELRSEGVEA